MIPFSFDHNSNKTNKVNHIYNNNCYYRLHRKYFQYIDHPIDNSMCLGRQERCKTANPFHRPPISLSRIHQLGEVYSSDPQLVRAHPVHHQTTDIESDQLLFNKIKTCELKSTSHSEPASPNFCINPSRSCNKFCNNYNKNNTNYNYNNNDGEISNNDNYNNAHHYGDSIKYGKDTLEKGGDDDDVILQCQIDKKCHSSKVLKKKNLVLASEPCFVKPLDDRHKCPICLEVLCQPYQTECGHRFCYECITKWMNHMDTGHPKCPNCKMKIHPSNIYPDNFAKREIDSLLIRCPNRYKGCSNICSLKDVNDHLEKECSKSNYHSKESEIIAKERSQSIKSKEFTEWLDFIVEKFFQASQPLNHPPKSNQHQLSSKLPSCHSISTPISIGWNKLSSERPRVPYKLKNSKFLKRFSTEDDYYSDDDDE